MAIKERKQITGTTAQINAYEGHEGQIVWDKEKKTLVGMSGTAGENYPLASQAYVDEGLESKEDKGVCLPLSGGKLTGALNLKYGGQLNQDQSTSGYGYTTLTSKHSDSLNSCTLYLANPDSIDKGIMILRYTDGSGGVHDLAMDGRNDTIHWNKRAVETVSGSGYNYIRYANGLQIVFDRVTIPSSGVRLYNYPVPFIGTVSVAVSQNQDKYVNSVNWSSTTQCRITSAWNTNEDNACPIVAIGRWR